MPTAPPHYCNHRGCPAVTHERFCSEHAKATRQQQDRERGSAAERGYGRRWRKAREWFLRRNPLCVACMDAGRTVAATVVDHIRPHRGDPVLFWQADNWQALCAPCHNTKTMREVQAA